MNYYNEFNPQAAQWLKNLVAAGLIPFGDVDNRSITEVDPDELKKYTQCHFFAGIAGWSYALQLAEWPTDRNVWTGSCPCQPFSDAGKRKGKQDERHLWPTWFNLIKECRPSTIFGEQVASAITHGWFDDVTNDLESIEYEWGGAIIPACSVGAPHKRDRLWFVGHSKHNGQYGHEVIRSNEETGNGWGKERADISKQFKGASTPPDVSGLSGCPEGERQNTRDVANAAGVLPQRCFDGQGQREPWGDSQFIQCPDGKQRLVKPGICLLADGVPARVVKLSALGNAIVPQVAAEFIKSFMDIEKDLNFSVAPVDI